MKKDYKTADAAVGIIVWGLFTILWILKITGIISWPWVWVLCPIWIPILFIYILIIIALIVVLIMKLKEYLT